MFKITLRYDSIEWIQENASRNFMEQKENEKMGCFTEWYGSCVM